MKSKYIILLFISLLMLAINTEDTTTKNGTESTNDTVNNNFYVEYYSSSLDQEGVNEYFYWVKYKNYLESNKGELSKLTKYFSPEDTTYFPTLYKSGWVFYLISAFVLVVLLIYIALRFLLGKFKGPKSCIDTKAYAKISFIIIIIGLSATTPLLSLSLAKIISIKNSVTLTTSALTEQAGIQLNNTQDIKTYQDSLGKLTYDPRSSTGDSTEYIKTVYKYDDILKEIQENNQRGIDFSVYLNSRMEALFILELLIFVCVFFFTLIGILFYFLKKPIFVTISSIFLVLLIVALFAKIGLNTAFFIFNIDYCEDIHSYLTTNSNPVAERGIGTFASCASKPTQITLNTARYELSKSFDLAYNKLNQQVQEKFSKSLPKLKRSNSLFEGLTFDYKSDSNIVSGLNSLILFNKILYNIETLIGCQEAYNFINFSEEKTCYLNITNHYYDMIYSFFAALTLLILINGVNRLYVCASPDNLNMSKNVELLDDTTIIN